MGKRLCLVLTILLARNLSFSQTETDNKAWIEIEKSIKDKKELDSVFKKLIDLRNTARSGNNELQLIRASYYIMLIDDERKEDTFYFRNSAFIDSFLLTHPDGRAQLTLHLLQAKRLSRFSFKSLRFNQSKYELKGIPNNYAAFAKGQLDSLIRLHFESALQHAVQLSGDPIEQYLWLVSDPFLYLFKPVVYDLVAGERINHFKDKEKFKFSALQDREPPLLLSQDEMIQRLPQLSKETKSLMIDWYADWISFNRNRKEAYYYIETLFRKWMAAGYYANDKIDSLYALYLEKIASSQINTVRAHGVYQLCLWWNKESLKYSPDPNYNFSYERPFQSKYQFLSAKALDLFEKNQKLLDSFAYLKSILVKMKNQILEKTMDVQMEDQHLPNENILATLTYKNTATLYYRIVKSVSLNSGTRKERVVQLTKKPSYRDEVLHLKLPSDYNFHRTHIKLLGLDKGEYFLLFSDKPFSENSSITNYVEFVVSGIAMINSDKRVYVLDRKSGLPIHDARVIGSYTKEVIVAGNQKQNKTVEKYYRTNKEGFVELTDPEIDFVEIFHNGDSLYKSIDQNEDRYDNEDIYDKEEYDDLIEYYTEFATMHIFTDRSIYRPGQTVFYKALFLTRNPKTGDWMVMSKENLRGKFLQNWYKRWLKEDEPAIIISDPFGKTMDSIMIKPNEYGSQSGSFKIPMSAATGEWEFDTDYYELGENEGVFQVEEYKRPSYEITIEDPGKKLLYPGDSMIYKVKLRSFAGAALNNVRVEYELTRNAWASSSNGPISIVKNSGFTNAEGEIIIRVVDSLSKSLEGDVNEQIRLDYTMEAKAIDETGETYSVENEFEITSRPVRINIPFAKVYDKGIPASIKIQALDPANNPLSRTVQLKIWKKTKARELKTVPDVDQWVFSVEELESTFPDISFKTSDANEKVLAFETTIQTGKEENFQIPFDILSAGEYEATGKSIENGRNTEERSIAFSVFDSKSKAIPDSADGFFHVPFNAINPGDTLKFLHGNSSGNYYTITQVKFYSRGKQVGTKSIYYHELSKQGINNWAKKIAVEAIDQLYLSQVYILNNKLYRQGQTVYLNSAATSEPEIIIEQYRRKLVPGSKETFIVSIKTKNENKAMELLTTMYDASLDKLEEHKWHKLEKERRRSISSSWPYSINFRTNSYDLMPEPVSKWDTIDANLWWLDPLDHAYFSGWNGNDKSATLMGKISGISLAQTDGFDEVVVVGYATAMKRELTFSMSLVTIRGQNSLKSVSMPLIILDGVPYTEDLSKLDPNIIKGAMVMKGADATAIYGARAAEGVLILSTTGEIILPELKEDAPQPKIRKNFSETAFFFPEVHADKDGFYKFSFTMPESVTEWNWKLFAHGKQAQSVYEERKLNTQLPMMVQPHMPRLLYMGDKIVLQSRITNLDTLETNGKINIKIEDLATGADITNQVTSQKEKDFNVGRKTNTSIGFELKIPAKQLNPLRIVVSASSANFADAEEHVLPVLNSKIFVRNSKSFYFINKDTVITGPALPNDAELYGLGLSINPKPQAALINSLPYLTNYPHSCAEQIFNKLYANAIAIKIMRTDSQAQESFRNALNKTPDSVLTNLPDQLQDQTMPWLGLSNRTIQLQSQLMKLFDTVKTNKHIEELLNKLYRLQNADGGIAWFEGGKSNDYISSYILAGFGRMRAEKLTKVPNIVIHQQFIDALLKYCASRVRPQINEQFLQYYLLSTAYAISFWKEEYTIADSVLTPLNNWIGGQMKSIHRRGLGEQSLLIISALRLSDRNSDNYNKAMAQLNSIRQLANNDETNGMRWKDIADADDLNNSAEETIGLLAEAFDQAGMTSEINPGIVKWLLTTRDEDRWSTTKGTAAAISRIQKENNSVVGPSQSLISKTLKLEVTDDNFTGKPFSFYRTPDNLSKVEVEKSSNLLARGSISWYYFSSQPALNPESSIQLEKKLFVYNDETKTWAEVVTGTVLRLGQKVRTNLTINTNKALRFVFIDDKRAAAFEPVEIASGYNYSGGVSYYQSVRDAGMQIFSEFIPSGKSTMSYEWIVSQEGEFLNGPASLQCMYKPEANAYSNSMIVRSAK